LGDSTTHAADGAQYSSSETDILSFPEECHPWEGDVIDDADDYDLCQYWLRVDSLRL
jgi:hypothetical protein